MSSTPHISLIECMDSWGAPTSTVRQPKFAARMGPMVLPQAMSLRTQNSWVGMPWRRATSLQRLFNKTGWVTAKCHWSATQIAVDSFLLCACDGRSQVMDFLRTLQMQHAFLCNKTQFWIAAIRSMMTASPPSTQRSKSAACRICITLQTPQDESATEHIQVQWSDQVNWHEYVWLIP